MNEKIVSTVFVVVLVSSMAMTSTGMVVDDVEVEKESVFDSVKKLQDDKKEFENRSDRIVSEFVLRLNKSMEGRVDVTIEFSIPQAVDSFQVNLSQRDDILEVEGFEKTKTTNDKQILTWDGELMHPSINASILVNSSQNSAFFARQDVAVVNPPFGVGFSYSSESNEIDSVVKTSIDGRGRVTETGWAYLGNYSRHVFEVEGKEVDFVVPSGIHTSNRNVTRMVISAAMTRLRLGLDKEKIVSIVSMDGRHSVKTGDTVSFIVSQGSMLYSGSQWIRQYVWASKNTSYSEEMKWFIDGSSWYYSFLVPVKLGHLEYSDFKRFDMFKGKFCDSCVLADISTLEDEESYYKGGLVLSVLDTRIREATGSERSLQDVFRKLNTYQGEVGLDDFSSALENVTGRSFDGFIDRYVESDGTPEMVNETLFEKYFTGGVFTEFGFSDRVEYGEDIEVSVHGRNTEYVNITRNIDLVVDGEVVKRWSMELGSGEEFSIGFNLSSSRVGTGVSSVVLRMESDEVASNVFVYRGNMSVVESIANLKSQDNLISDAEFRRALELWKSGEVVPDTGGKKIDSELLREIIRVWSSQEKV